VDVEVSFARPETIYALVEPLMPEIFKEIGREVTLRSAAWRTPRRSRSTVGQTRSALRHGDPRPVGYLFATRSSASSSRSSRTAARARLRGQGGNRSSRSQLDVLVDQAKQMGFTGLIWVRPGEPPLSSVKSLSEAALAPALDRVNASSDDLLLMAAGPADATSKLLGQLRLAIAKKENLLNPEAFEFLWVTDSRCSSTTRKTAGGTRCTTRLRRRSTKTWTSSKASPARCVPRPTTWCSTDRKSARQRQDPRRGMQRRIFDRLGITDEEARARFGFFLEALEYGTPPHGGIALGLDRIVAILAGEASIREVIAFRRRRNAVDLMAGAPSPVDAKQLRELHLKIQN